MTNGGRTLALILLLAQPAILSAAGKRALLVGINKYRHSSAIPGLNGCVNDVQRFRDLLIAKFQFAPEDILMLTDEQATREGILRAFQTHLTEKTTAGDEVVFYYAGHGSTVRNQSMTPGYEQTIVPHDSRDPEGKVLDIRDSELRLLFTGLKAKTSNIVAILDSCHSGTAIRGNRARSIPEDTRPAPPALVSRGAGGPVDRGIVFIAGSRSDQTSFEHRAEGAEHGALSWFLAKELSRDNPEATWREVMDRVRVMVTARYPNQEPQLEGSAADRKVFSSGSAASEPYFLISKQPDGGISINGGRVHGLSQGSVMAVYAPGERSFDATKVPVGKVRLEGVEAFRAGASLVTGTVEEGSRAVEREHQYGDFRLRIYWGTGSHAAVEKAKQALAREPHFEVAEGPEDCDFQVLQEGGRIVTAAADASSLSSPIDGTDAEAAITLIDRIHGWAKWFQLAALDSPGVKSAVRLEVTPVAPRAGGRVLDGDKLRVSVQNLSAAPLFVALLDLSGDGSVSVIPLTVAGAAEQLAPGAKASTTIEAYVADGRASVRDILKVFGTRTAVDFRALTSGAIRGGGPTAQDPLSRLFASALIPGARDVRPAVYVSDWGSDAKAIVVEKK